MKQVSPISHSPHSLVPEYDSNEHPLGVNQLVNSLISWNSFDQESSDDDLVSNIINAIKKSFSV